MSVDIFTYVFFVESLEEGWKQCQLIIRELEEVIVRLMYYIWEKLLYVHFCYQMTSAIVKSVPELSQGSMDRITKI